MAENVNWLVLAVICYHVKLCLCVCVCATSIINVGLWLYDSDDCATSSCGPCVQWRQFTCRLHGVGDSADHDSMWWCISSTCISCNKFIILECNRSHAVINPSLFVIGVWVWKCILHKVNYSGMWWGYHHQNTHYIYNSDTSELFYHMLVCTL